jgi:hypothetical protein
VYNQRAFSGEDWYSRWCEAVRWLDTYLNLVSVQDVDLVLCPVGLRHPYHILIAFLCEEFWIRGKFGLYSEAPYNRSKWTQVIEKSHPRIDELVKVVYEPVLQELKEEVFRDVYPTETSYFVWTKDAVMNNSCTLYLPPAVERSLKGPVVSP